jgi:hypothetical protein
MGEVPEPDLANLLQAMDAKVQRLIDSRGSLTRQQWSDELTALAQRFLDLATLFLELAGRASDAASSLIQSDES